MRTSAWVLAGVGIAIGGCGPGTSVVEVGGGGSDAGADGAAGDGGAASGELTLASCTTSIADDAPAFFKTYFRCVTITTSADAITIATDALPPHRSNYWGASSPNYEPFDTSRGAEYHANPNTLSKHAVSFTIPRSPVKRDVIVSKALVDGVVGSAPQEYPMGPAGVALDAVLLFNPLAAPGDDIDKEKYTFDAYDAHPTQDGTYHYHTASPGPLEVLSAAGLTTSTSPGSASIEVYGIMCDGAVVLGCKELDGTAPDASALDAQGGHTTDIVDAQGTTHFTARYHVHVCPSDPAGRKYTPEIQVYSTCAK